MTDLVTQRRLQALENQLERLRKADAPIGAIRARVYNSGAITLTTGVAAALTFDSERWDTAGLHSTVTNTSRLTAPVFGLYVGTGHVRFAANAVGIREISVSVNGTTTIAIQDILALVGGAVTILSVPFEYELAAGDYVELVAYQNSGGNLNVEVAANYSPEFSMCRIA